MPPSPDALKINFYIFFAFTIDISALFRRVTLDGWAYVDAAKAAGISLWACYKRVERTQKKLRRAIEEHPERFF